MPDNSTVPRRREFYRNIIFLLNTIQLEWGKEHFLLQGVVPDRQNTIVKPSMAVQHSGG
jgi:hypothetical protein